MLEYGADIARCDTAIGNTPLLTAIAMGDAPLALFFIRKIQTINDPKVRQLLNQKDTGIECRNTPLILALKKGLDEVALTLINAGADVNLPEKQGLTPLHWAAILRKNAILSALLAHGANKEALNEYGVTAHAYYRYEIRLLDGQYPIDDYSICRMSNMNMPELSDLIHRVCSQHTSSEQIVVAALQRWIIERNKQVTDTKLVTQLQVVQQMTNRTETSLEQRHWDMASEQFPRQKNAYSQINRLADRHFEQLAAVINDEEIWRKTWQTTKNPAKDEQDHIEQKALSTTYKICGLLQPHMPYQSEELAKKNTATLLNAVMADINAEQKIDEILDADLSSEEKQLAKKNLQSPLQKLSALKTASANAPFFQAALKKQIQSFEQAGTAYTPAIEQALKALGFAKCKALKQDIVDYVHTINEGIYQNSSFLNLSFALRNARLATAYILNQIKQEKDIFDIWSDFLAKYGSSFKSDKISSVEFEIKDAIAKLCELQILYSNHKDFIKSILGDRIAILELQPMAHQITRKIR